MIKAVIDTNVLISGVFWKGTPYQVIKAWQNNSFRWFISPEILEEYRRVLEEISRQHPGFELGPIFEVIGLHCEMVAAKPLRGICRDPDDDKFIAAAVGCGATYIVSGDRALLDVKQFQGVSIVRPVEFLHKL